MFAEIDAKLDTLT